MILLAVSEFKIWRFIMKKLYRLLAFVCLVVPGI